MKIMSLACAGLLLEAKARPDDHPSEKVESTCAAAKEKETGGGSTTLQDETSAQGSAETKGKKKHGLFRSWLHMAAETQANQPDWLSPLATTSGRLKQELRYDIWDQPSAQGNRTYQFGGGKGLEFITSSRTQILAGIPTYTLHSPKGSPGGFGD